MSSLNNQLRLSASLLLMCLFLAGCGFHPLYAKNEEGGNPVLVGVKVETSPSGRPAQQLREALEDKLNPNGSAPKPAYRLVATVGTSTAGVAVSRDGTISSYNVYVNSSYKLYRISDGKIVTTGNLSQIGSYSYNNNAYFSTYITADDAVKNGITELAEIYRMRLDAYLTQPPQPTAQATSQN